MVTYERGEVGSQPSIYFSLCLLSATYAHLWCLLQRLCLREDNLWEGRGNGAEEIWTIKLHSWA